MSGATKSILGVLAVVILIGIGWLFLDQDQDIFDGLGSSSSQTGLYATMLAFNPNEGFGNLQENLGDGWLAYIEAGNLSGYLANLRQRWDRYVPWAESSGFSMDRALPGTFVWNVHEPYEGEGYDWSLPDLVMEHAGEAGMDMSAVITPFAAWD